MQQSFDRPAEDIGNSIHLEHVNVNIPSQHQAMLFYVAGLGLTRDPYLMVSDDNMWVNVGRSQFHLPSGKATVLRGHTGLVISGRQALLERPRVHVPGLDVRGWRKLIEFRQKLLARRVACKNQIRAVIRAQGLAAPRGLWGKKGIAWLKGLELQSSEKLALEITLEEISDYDQKIARVQKELAAIASRHPGVALLMTIPGVGIRTAEAFCAYVDDIRRFASSRQVGSYFGLVPCLDSSAGKDRFGHITGDGPPTVRKLLSEAAWMGIRHNPTLREFFKRVMREDPDRKKIALVATAHYLCRIMAAMLRNGEAWRGSDPSEQKDASSDGPDEHLVNQARSGWLLEARIFGLPEIPQAAR
jgi:hypothetical protein